MAGKVGYKAFVLTNLSNRSSYRWMQRVHLVPMHGRTCRVYGGVRMQVKLDSTGQFQNARRSQQACTWCLSSCITLTSPGANIKEHTCIGRLPRHKLLQIGNPGLIKALQQSVKGH